MNRELIHLLDKVQVIKINGKKNNLVKGLAYDSRDVKTGYIFFALKGIHTDGHEYIDKAIDNGAAVIFHSDDISMFLPEVTYIKVKGVVIYKYEFIVSYFYGHSREIL